MNHHLVLYHNPACQVAKGRSVAAVHHLPRTAAPPTSIATTIGGLSRRLSYLTMPFIPTHAISGPSHDLKPRPRRRANVTPKPQPPTLTWEVPVHDRRIPALVCRRRIGRRYAAAAYRRVIISWVHLSLIASSTHSSTYGLVGSSAST